MCSAWSAGSLVGIGAGHAVIDRDNIHRWSMIAARMNRPLPLGMIDWNIILEGALAGLAIVTLLAGVLLGAPR